MKEADLPEHTGRLYHRYKNKWVVKGYICYHCHKYYHSLRKELFEHVYSCTGPTDKKKKKQLED